MIVANSKSTSSNDTEGHTTKPPIDGKRPVGYTIALGRDGGGSPWRGLRQSRVWLRDARVGKEERRRQGCFCASEARWTQPGRGQAGISRLAAYGSEREVEVTATSSASCRLCTP
ncbi:hypothetical protein FIBSPDRAFT_583662 [Athelia psychrophila]|uniref:Uncharacterized protein n=1 Tax=Athelia psychrophila TaxID=1759441 RepID=A0A166HEM3_9AGAM|nr:hypothetical protein FIBSPDRAFT_583662 [Fibularhizoctonia sp. CBS 109695]